MRRALLVRMLAVLVGAASISAAAPASSAPDPPRYVPPVDAPVVDGFRPPATPFGAGNRGLEYGTDPGTPVAAVGGRSCDLRRVGRRHAARDGAPRRRRAHDLLVPPAGGRRGRAGSAPGRPGRAERWPPPPRRPAWRQLLRPGVAVRRRPPSVHLVPFDEPPGEGEQGERSAIGQLIDGAGHLLDGASGAAGAVGTWMRDGGSQLLRTVDQYAPSLHLPVGVRRQLVHHAPGLATGPMGRRPTLHRGRRSGAATSRSPRRRARRRARIRQRPAPRSTRCAPRSSGTRRPMCCGSATPAGGCPTRPTGSRRSRCPSTAPPRPRRTSVSREAGSPTSSRRSPPVLRACRST